MTELSIYWITRLDSISRLVQNAAVFFSMFLMLSVIAACVGAAFMTWAKNDAIANYGAEHIDEDIGYCSTRSICRVIAKLTKAFAELAIISSLAAVFIPTTKEYCAVKVVPAILNNEKAAPLADELYSLGIEWLKELKPQAASSSQPAASSH